MKKFFNILFWTGFALLVLWSATCLVLGVLHLNNNVYWHGLVLITGVVFVSISGYVQGKVK